MNNNTEDLYSKLGLVVSDPSLLTPPQEKVVNIFFLVLAYTHSCQGV